MVSNDPQFTSDLEKTRSGIDYPKLIHSYKKLILKFQTTNSARFDEIIQFYDNIIFDICTKGKDREKPKEKSSGSEIDFKTDSENTGNGEESAICNFMFNARLEDWYEHGPTHPSHSQADPEAQLHTQATMSDLDSDIMPPVANVLSTVVQLEPTAAQALPTPQPAPQQVRPLAAQSLGLGIPPAIRQSDSVRRRVTPLPLGQFCTPPILDHSHHASDDSDLSETPPSPASVPTNQLPTPADQPPASASSKRGKTGKGSKKSKASGGRGGRGGRQRAKATATLATE